MSLAAICILIPLQTLAGFGQIEGIVSDQASGDPVAGVLVQVVGGSESSVTDETGAFAFRAPAGAQIIEATAYSYEVLSHPVIVLENQTLSENLVLVRRPLMTVSGTVFYPGANPVDGGTPVPGASIVIENVPEPPVVADAAGHFVVSLPRDTDYQLSVTAGVDGLLSQRIPFSRDLNLDLYLNAVTISLPKLVAAPELVAVELAYPKQLLASSYLFNMGSEDLAWAVREAADWLELAPTSGVIAPGTYQELSFGFDESALPFGTHTAPVTVESNDPANPVFGLEAQITLIPGVPPVPVLESRRAGLLGAVPNPFNPQTVIAFAIASAGPVKLEVFDVRGHLVKRLVEAAYEPGNYRVTWQGEDETDRAAPSGLYFARLTAEGTTDLQKMMLVR